MQYHKTKLTAAALVLAGGIAAGSYELASGGDQAHTQSAAAASPASATQPAKHRQATRARPGVSDQ
jgi:hypothetical protein